MQFQINSLIIWPKNTEKSPRVLTFAPGKVNVISGKSNTGKSALIKIVDYVLASRDCRIPTIGPIRSHSSWFGLLVITDEGQILLARREAGSAKSTDDYMVIESVPADFSLVGLVPTKNTNRQYVKKLLQRLARLPNLDQDFFESGSGYKGQPSFGDLKAFLFQPQSIVASDTTLFYKTDEEGHEGKLKEVFPFALGAITGEILVRRHRYLDAQKRSAILLRKIHALEENLREAISDVRPKYILGVQLGLLPVLTWESALPQDDQLQAMQSRLVELAKASPATFVEKGDPAAAIKAIAELRSHERRLQNLLVETRGRLQQIQELRRGYTNLRTDKVEQLNRLRVVEILEDAISIGSTCPVCNSETEEPSLQWLQLKHSLGLLKTELPEVARALPQLQREEVLLTRRVNQLEEQIRSTSSELREMSVAPTFKADDLERARFIGQIQQWSTSADDSGVLADLREQFDSLNREIERLRSELDEWDVETRMNAVLTRWSVLAMRYVDIMRLEEQGKLLQLDTKNLTIRIVLDDGRDPRLSEVGGGHNWLGYHIATLLALHELFSTQKYSCVPSFLMLDQPSQTQFPDSEDEDAEEEDVAAVTQAFQALGEGTRRANERLQIIVTEHGGTKLWKGVSAVHDVERWRRGRSLIPWHWMPSVPSDLNGKRADYALQDELGYIATQISAKYGLPASRSELRILRSVFESKGIKFRIQAVVEGAQHHFEGLLATDLTVEIAYAASA